MLDPIGSVARELKLLAQRLAECSKPVQLDGQPDLQPAKRPRQLGRQVREAHVLVASGQLLQVAGIDLVGATQVRAGAHENRAD